MLITSKTGRDVSSISDVPSEEEVLFPPGTQFKVLAHSVDPKTGLREITLIENT